MIANTGKVFNPSAADKNHGVLLKVMSFTTNIGSDF
jgi:hypothetical protein